MLYTNTGISTYKSLPSIITITITASSQLKLSGSVLTLKPKKNKFHNIMSYATLVF